MKSEWDNKHSCAACLPWRQASAQWCCWGRVLLLSSAASQRHVLHCREHCQRQVGWTCVGCKILFAPAWCKWTWTGGISFSAEGKLLTGLSSTAHTELCTHTAATHLLICVVLLLACPHYCSQWHTGRTLHCPVLIQWCLSLLPCQWSQVLLCSSLVPHTFTGNSHRIFETAQQT